MKSVCLIYTVQLALLGSAFAGTDNEVLGTNAGGTQAGNRNVVVGDHAGSEMTTTNENTIVGAYAGLFARDTTTYNNTVFGFRANGIYTQAEWEANQADAVNNPLPDVNSDGSAGLIDSVITNFENTYFGYEAGLRDYRGISNTMIGYQAGKSNTQGTDNTYIGSKAGALGHRRLGSFGYHYPLDNTFVGSEAGYSSHGQDNTFIGAQAGRNMQDGDDNLAIGRRAMQASSTAFGATTPMNVGSNVAVGYHALHDAHSAWGNAVFGMGAGLDIGTSTYNTFFGTFTGSHTENTSYNTFVGALSGIDNNRTNFSTQGANNTYLGTGSGAFNRSGNNNVYIGAFADMADWDTISDQAINDLQLHTRDSASHPVNSANGDYEVSNSTVVGAGSYVRGDNNVTVGYNIRSDAANVVAIGSGATVSDPAHTGAILIGDGLQSRAANLAIIGGSNTTAIEPSADGVTALGSPSYRFASATAESFVVRADAAVNAVFELKADAGTNNDDQWKLEAVNGGAFKIASLATGSYVDILTAQNSGNVTVAGDVNVNSDRRLKREIKAIENAPELLSQLKGKTYFWKSELGRDDRKQYGLIAQEVEKVLPELVLTHSKTGIKSVNYQGFVPLLIDSVNAGKTKSVQQEQQLDQLEDQLIQLQQELAELEGDNSVMTTAAN